MRYNHNPVTVAVSLLLLASCTGSEPGTEAAGAPTDLEAMPSGVPVAGPADDVPVKYAEIDLRVADTADTEAEIDSMVRTYGGYVGSRESVEPNAGVRRTTLTLKVDAKKFDRFIDAVKKLGECTAEVFRVEDVTFTFMDLGARLANQRGTEKRLVERLSALDGSDAAVAGLERELSAVREKIAVLNARLRFMQEQIAYSTLVLNITDGPGAEAGACVLSEVMGHLPWFIAEAVLLIIVFLVYLRRRKPRAIRTGSPGG